MMKRTPWRLQTSINALKSGLSRIIETVYLTPELRHLFNAFFNGAGEPVAELVGVIAVVQSALAHHACDRVGHVRIVSTRD
jgi:hypothetical protein